VLVQEEARALLDSKKPRALWVATMIYTFSHLEEPVGYSGTDWGTVSRSICKALVPSPRSRHKEEAAVC
jgi:hypothetical protein